MSHPNRAPQPDPPAAPARPDRQEYRTLSEFRYLIRRFLEFSQIAAAAAGLTSRQHQALLAIKGFPRDGEPTVGELAERLRIRHHSMVELVDRLGAAGLVRRAARSGGSSPRAGGPDRRGRGAAGRSVGDPSGRAAPAAPGPAGRPRPRLPRAGWRLSTSEGRCASWAEPLLQRGGRIRRSRAARGSAVEAAFGVRSRLTAMPWSKAR